MDKTGMYQPKQKNVTPVTGLLLVLQQNVLTGAGHCETKKSIFSLDVRVFCSLQQNVAPISGLITALHGFVGAIVCLFLALHRFLGAKGRQMVWLELRKVYNAWRNTKFRNEKQNFNLLK